jgi:hypothetical protein
MFLYSVQAPEVVEGHDLELDLQAPVIVWMYNDILLYIII